MFLRPTGYAVASVTDCTYFENERSASALVVTEKCTSVPAVGCQQLVSKKNKPAAGNIELCRKRYLFIKYRRHS